MVSFAVFLLISGLFVLFFNGGTEFQLREAKIMKEPRYGNIFGITNPVSNFVVHYFLKSTDITRICLFI